MLFLHQSAWIISRLTSGFVMKFCYKLSYWYDIAYGISLGVIIFIANVMLYENSIFINNKHICFTLLALNILTVQIGPIILGALLNRSFVKR